MKRVTIITSLLLLLTLGWAGVSQAAITFFWRAEGTTLDGTDDFTAGDSTATANGAPAINATAALVGSNGIQIDAAGEQYRFAPTSIIATSAGSVAFWVRFQTWNATAYTFQSRGAASANDNIILSGSATDEVQLQIRNATSGQVTLTTTAVNIANNTTYFVTFSWDDAADLRRLRVYNSAGTLIEEVSASSAFTGPAALDAADGLRFGDGAGVSTAFYLDNLFVGSAYADADCFFTNRSITSYTSYSCGAAASTPRGLLLGVYP